MWHRLIRSFFQRQTRRIEALERENAELRSRLQTLRVELARSTPAEPVRIYVEGDSDFVSRIYQAAAILRNISFLTLLNSFIKIVRIGELNGAWGGFWPAEELTITVAPKMLPNLQHPYRMVNFLVHELGHAIAYSLNKRYYGQVGEVRAEFLAAAALATLSKAEAQLAMRPWRDIPDTDPLPGNPEVPDV